MSKTLSNRQVPSPISCNGYGVSVSISFRAANITAVFIFLQYLNNLFPTLSDKYPNGVETEIIMKPLKFNDFGNENDNAQETKSTETSDNIKMP